LSFIASFPLMLPTPTSFRLALMLCIRRQSFQLWVFLFCLFVCCGLVFVIVALVIDGSIGVGYIGVICLYLVQNNGACGNCC
jgi:hypothetical protein